VPLLIETRLAASPIQGLGLFAVAPIPAGTAVWRFDPRVDRLVGDEAEELRTLYPGFAHLEEVHLCEIPGEGLLLLGDDARFINHAVEPLLHRARADDWRSFCAARDIAAGEELTVDYEEICGVVRSLGAARYLGIEPG
jgi:SET domain-containing protein